MFYDVIAVVVNPINQPINVRDFVTVKGVGFGPLIKYSGQSASPVVSQGSYKTVYSDTLGACSVSSVSCLCRSFFSGSMPVD